MNDEPELKKFLVTYHLPYGMKITELWKATDIGAVNHRWQVLLREGASMTVKMQDNSLQVFRARDVVTVNIRELGA